MEPLLSVENLEVHFPVKRSLLSRRREVVHAVDDISLSLAPGETLGVVGESGCGKTTMGLAILDLVAPTAGRVAFRGRDVSQMSDAQRKRLRREMQIIFQDPYASLNPRMTLNRIVGDPMKIHGLCQGRELKERVAYLLERVGLTPEQGHRYPHEFSGGQRQRVGIARALALNPRVIIGDEPVSALDVSIQAQIINLLLDLQQEFDLSYIIISHDLAVVEHICDRIAVMYLGKFVETAPYHGLYAHPLHPYTQALLSAVPVPDPDLAVERIILEGDVPSPLHPPPGCRFYPRCGRCMPRCRQEEPRLREVEAGHQVACHLYD